MSASNPIPAARPWAEIDLGALVANARTVLSVSGSRLLPMVKANGYGTGAVAVARALEAVDPWGFGVVTVEEGRALREAGITRPVIVFGPVSGEGMAACLRDRLRPVLGDLGAVRHWLGLGAHPFHVEVDTGMARLGFRWTDGSALQELAPLLAEAVGWEGIFTHFHSADSDPASIAVQWDRLHGVVAALGRRPPMVHAANSAAALLGTTYGGDLVRPGIFLYGGAAGSAHAPRTVVRLRAPVVATRRLAAGDSVSYGATWRAPRATTIATVAAGYADGVPRRLGGAGRVEIGGVAYPIVGRVTMDFLMADVGDAAVTMGDVATLFGGCVSLEAQAAAAGTISYELLTSIGARVERRYGEAG